VLEAVLINHHGLMTVQGQPLSIVFVEKEDGMTSYDI